MKEKDNNRDLNETNNLINLKCYSIMHTTDVYVRIQLELMSHTNF